MAQEQAGRTLRSATWRQELTRAVLATWPADPHNRTKKEWEAVRAAMTGGHRLPSSVVTASTRQILRFQRGQGRLPTDLFELQGAPQVARLLLLCGCVRNLVGGGDRQDCCSRSRGVAGTGRSAR
jgi:hypothetical protein